MRAEPSLADALAAGEVLQVQADVTHVRRGAVRHVLCHGADYVLFGDAAGPGNRLFGRNRAALVSVHDRDHGGPRGKGMGAAWARDVLRRDGLDLDNITLALMTQPRFLGFWFTPISFWIAFRGAAPVAVIAEVNNTFGDRHSYLCRHPGYAPIRPGDEFTAQKVFHVSPFQDISGSYRFRFSLGRGHIAIRIAQIDGDEGVIATLAGTPRPLTAGRLLGAGLRRPGGALRVLGLIYWHALRLRLKGARYRRRPQPPHEEVSR